MKANYKNILIQAFPKDLEQDISKVLSIIPSESKNVFDLIHINQYTIQVDEETLKIPTRVYFNEPKQQDKKQLTDRQNDILNCIYTRHYSGYVRENCLSKLLENFEYWTTPFIVQLLGEYVYELLLVINKKINKQNLNHFNKFKYQNPKYWQQTESRMISYWNEYYRHKFPVLKTYLGYKIVDRIKECT